MALGIKPDQTAFAPEFNELLVHHFIAGLFERVILIFNQT